LIVGVEALPWELDERFPALKHGDTTLKKEIKI
jgi:hypothetical protein